MEGVQLQPTPTCEEAAAVSRLDRLRQTGNRAMTIVAAGSVATAALLGISKPHETYHVGIIGDVKSEPITTEEPCNPASPESLKAVDALVATPAPLNFSKYYVYKELHGLTQLPWTAHYDPNEQYRESMEEARAEIAKQENLHVFGTHNAFETLKNDTINGSLIQEPQIVLETYKTVAQDFADNYGIQLVFSDQLSADKKPYGPPDSALFDTFETRYTLRSTIEFLSKLPAEKIKKLGLNEIVYYHSSHDYIDEEKTAMRAAYVSGPGKIYVNTHFAIDAQTLRHELGHLEDMATCEGNIYNDPTFIDMIPKGLPHMSLEDARKEQGMLATRMTEGLGLQDMQALQERYQLLRTTDLPFISSYGKWAWDRSIKDKYPISSAVEEKAELGKYMLGDSNGLATLFNPNTPTTIQLHARELLARQFEHDPEGTAFMIKSTTHNTMNIGTFLPKTCTFEAVRHGSTTKVTSIMCGVGKGGDPGP